MALILIGSSRSRTMRNLWTLAELGVDFEHRPLASNDPWLKSPEFLSLNPAGAIPLLIDDGFALAESLAINLHLTRKFGFGSLYPADPQGQAEAWRWSLWAQAHVEPWVQRDQAVLAPGAIPESTRTELLGQAFTPLERALAGRTWLLGDTFTVADLNVAGILSPSRVAPLDLERWPAVAAWQARCHARPASLRARGKYAD